jgi:hypothetical protein
MALTIGRFVYPIDPMRKRKIALDPAHLRFRMQTQTTQGEASSPPPGVS